MVTHLGGALAVAMVCAVQGRAAAVQRRLLYCRKSHRSATPILTSGQPAKATR